MGEPTDSAILTALKDAAARLKEEDTFFMLFAGHGVERRDGEVVRACLLARNANLEEDCGLIEMPKLRRALSRVACRYRAVFLDCCRNDPEAGKGDGDNLMGEFLARNIEEVFTREEKSAKTTILMTACRSGQRAYEWDGEKHGAFSFFLLQGIAGAAWRDNMLEARDLCAYVERELARWAKITGKEQESEFKQLESAQAVVLAIRADKASSPGVDEPSGQKGEATPKFREAAKAEKRRQATEDAPRRRPETPVSEQSQAAQGGLKPLEGKEMAAIDLGALAPGCAEARERQEAYAGDQGVPVEVENSIGMRLRLVPPGTFQMGARAHPHERPIHEVTFPHPCWMGRHAVTQALYKAVTGADPSSFKGARNPVECVSWDDAVAFCRQLTEMERAARVLPAGWSYRLPTEAEWEYACRAGAETEFCFGDDLDARQANFDGRLPYGKGKKGECRAKTTPAGSFKPNAWGLSDMHGNVWEWCADWYGKYAAGPQTDPAGPVQGSGRVLRGGSWFDRAEQSRSAHRNWHVPPSRFNTFGFRVVLSPIIPSATPVPPEEA
jgi:formylglycine-generating enzyme required for sulfatase activity